MAALCYNVTMLKLPIPAEDFVLRRLLFALVILVAACSPAAAPTSTPTSTPEPTATPAATATPTPTLVPSPTPTVAPELLLQHVDKLLRDGDQARGLFALESLLTLTPAPPLAAEAALLLGQEQLRDGQFDSARESFTLYMDLQPPALRDARAFFWRASALARQENWPDAVADYGAWMQLRPGAIDSYALERIGDAQLASGQLDVALSSYSAAAESGRSLQASMRLREKLADSLLAAGRLAEAVAQYETILTLAGDAVYRAGIRLLAARALLVAGDEAEALARMRALFEEQPGTPAAYEAMLILLEREVALDGAAVGRVSFFAGDVQRAQAALAPLAQEAAGLPAALWLMLGRAERDLGATDAAVAAFNNVAADDALYGEASLELGRTRFWSGDTEGAIEHYLQVAANLADSPEAAEALWRAGFLQGSLDLPLEARVTFEQLAEQYPDTAQARSGLWLAAEAAVLHEDSAIAEQFYTRVAETVSGAASAEAWLRAGQLARQRGDEEVAKSGFNAAIAAAPDSFFAARSRDLLSGRSPLQPAPALRFAFDEAAELTQAEEWLRSTFSITQEGPLWPASAGLLADGRLQRGEALWALGLHSAAREEFAELLDEYSDDGLGSYQLAVHYRGLGDYYSSIFAAANILNAAGVATLEAPPWLARLRYPVYWQDVVQDVARQHAMDPMLLFSLIRLESLFNPWAEAAAGEKGLTQVIPTTGDYIAGQISWPNYQHSDLFRPQASVTFGAWYLAEQLDRFGLDALVALAGYNAGPGRALEWQQAAQGDADRFLAAIDIESTRNYVQLIYGFHHVYRTLYGVSDCAVIFSSCSG